MSDRPRSDPPTDSLTTLSEDERDAALRRFEALRPHLQDGVALTEAARAANVPVRSLQRWVTRYRKGGLAGLVRRQRSDAGRRRLPPVLVGTIEGLALCTPRLTAAAIHRRLRTLVEVATLGTDSASASRSMRAILVLGKSALLHGSLSSPWEPSSQQTTGPKISGQAIH